MKRHTPHINSWQKFAKYIRAGNKDLLYRVPELNKPVLISGCQRSGTTLLTHIFLESTHFVDFRKGHDSELDGALILCRFHELPKETGRYCFQTTYLNEKVTEYFKYPGKFQLIFIIRNPYSVVYSMCHHWTRKSQFSNFALNELFFSCGDKTKLTQFETFCFKLLGAHGIPNIKKACLSYVGKTAQLFKLKEKFGSRVLVLDYDDLINQKKTALSLICNFTGLPAGSLNPDSIHGKGIVRADRLCLKEKNMIQKICWDTYKKARIMAVN